MKTKTRTRPAWNVGTVLLDASPYAGLGMLLGIFLRYGIRCVQTCRTVLWATIPFGTSGSTASYIRRTGLLRHLLAMPDSARTCFLTHAAGIVALVALTAGVLLAAYRLLQKQIAHWIAEYATRNEAQCKTASDPRSAGITLFRTERAVQNGLQNPAYNPFFLYSASEDTNAVFLEWLENELPSAGLKPVYAKCGDFLQTKDGMQPGTLADERIAADTIFVIDDLHSLMHFEDLQAEFGKCLIGLYAAGARMMLLSACSPYQIPELTGVIMKNFETAFIGPLS